MESRLLSLLETEPYGIEVNKLIDLCSASDEMVELNFALNALLADHRVEMIKWGHKMRVATKAAEPAGLTIMESLFNSLVIDAGNKGISILQLQEHSGLRRLQIHEALKSLEQKKLVKVVKFVGTMEWCYMPYDAVVDVSLLDDTVDSERQCYEELISTLQRHKERTIKTSYKGTRQDDEELVKTLADVEID